MKLSFLDFMFYKEHARFYSSCLNSLSKFADVSVFTKEDYYQEYKEYLLNINFIENKNLRISNHRILNRITSIWVMIKSAIFTKRSKPDYIFVAAFDTIAFSIGRLFFGFNTKNMYLLHNINTDELSNSVKRFLFNQYKNKVNHIVMEEFIRSYLIKAHGVKAELIHVIPHPTNENSENNNSDPEFFMVGISNSNDDELIQFIIDKECKDSMLLKSQKKVVLRSKTQIYDNGYLKVINGYLSKAEYDKYISKSRYIFMPFRKTFHYRMSGTLVDALSNNKKVLARDLPLFNLHAKEYPEVCTVFHDNKEAYQLIVHLKDEDFKTDDFYKFKNKHSDDMLLKSFQKIFIDDH